MSTTTVALAYEALKQGGFVTGRKRSGFFVNPDALTDLGHDTLEPHVPAGAAGPPDRVDYRAFFRERNFNLARVVKPADCLVRYRYPFVCGLTDPSLFPSASWRECVRDSVNVVEVGNWATDYSDIDDPMLVEQLIQRVFAKRGIAARPEEVLITVGGQQALYLAIRLLLSRGETLSVEDPGYPTYPSRSRGHRNRARRSPGRARREPYSRDQRPNAQRGRTTRRESQVSGEQVGSLYGSGPAPIEVVTLCIE